MSAGIEWVDDDGPVGLRDEPRPEPVSIEALLAGRTGERCCIRLNCAERGLPTEDARCPRCEHPTRPLRDYRFPRTVFG